MMNLEKPLNLFEEIKDIRIREIYEEWIEPFSVDPDILYEIQRRIGYPITRAQVRFILEQVPIVFPEDWKYPDRFVDLTDREKRVVDDLMKYGYFPIPLFYIERVIELGMELRIGQWKQDGIPTF